MNDLTRRETIALGAAALAASPSMARPDEAPRFRHGVASGDPAQDSVVLWTRVTTDEEALPVSWDVALDPAFRKIIRTGETVARRESDHTVKVVPGGLEPGRTHHYRFRAAGEISPAGRTRTLASGRLDRLGIALMSCANYSLGFFTTYDAVARDPSIDFLLHCGDYIYEYGNDLLQQSSFFMRPSDPPHEIVSLDDYRRRHASHKADPHSQAMHAAHPLIALWDDHEVCNDTWAGGGENHQPATEGEWNQRRDAAIRAYYEWMPIRDPRPGQSRLEAWRTYRFGDLATLVTLETRLSGRDEPVDLADYKDKLRTAEDRAALIRDVLGDPARQMLSPAMKAALKESLGASVESGQPWRLIGNGTLMARIWTPDLRAAGIRAEDHPELAFLDRYTNVVWKGDHHLPDSTQSWDGYAGARQQFYALCQDAGARDLLVLTGDSHCFWSNTLTDDHDVPMGVELGTAAANFPSEWRMAGFRPDLIGTIDALYRDASADVAWTDGRQCGYVRVILEPHGATAEFIGVETSTARNYQTTRLRTEHINRTDGTLVASSSP